MRAARSRTVVASRNVVASRLVTRLVTPVRRCVARAATARAALCCGMRLALVFAALALGLPVAAADPHPMSSGATPAPTTDAQVAMSAETLAIAIDQRAASVKAAVTLANPGAATKLVVGFPCAVGDDAGAIDVPCKIPLTVTVGGKRVKATKRKTSKSVHHWTWPVKLGAGASVELVVSYRAPLVNDRYTVPAYGMGLFTYRLTTGARWAGPIGTLRITVDHLHDALLYVAPAGGVRTPGRITWQLDGVEPTEEVILIPHPYAGNRLAQQIGGRTAVEAAARIAAGDYRRADVEAAIAALRDSDAELAQWLPTITRVAGLAAPPEAQARASIAASIAVLERLATSATR